MGKYHKTEIRVHKLCWKKGRYDWMKGRVDRDGVREVFRAYNIYSIIGIYFEKDRVKLSLFSDNIILYVEYPREFTQNLLE